MSAAIRLEDLRLHYPVHSTDAWGERTRTHARAVTASEVASVLSDTDLLGELVRRGKATSYWRGENGYWMASKGLGRLDHSTMPVGESE